MIFFRCCSIRSKEKKRFHMSSGRAAVSTDNKPLSKQLIATLRKPRMDRITSRALIVDVSFFFLNKNVLHQRENFTWSAKATPLFLAYRLNTAYRVDRGIQIAVETKRELRLTSCAVLCLSLNRKVRLRLKTRRFHETKPASPAMIIVKSSCSFDVLVPSLNEPFEGFLDAESKSWFNIALTYHTFRPSAWACLLREEECRMQPISSWSLFPLSKSLRPQETRT